MHNGTHQQRSEQTRQSDGAARVGANKSQGQHSFPLQRALGNQVMRRLLGAQAPSAPPADSRITLQKKLTVGPAGDAYEREADRVAEKVMRATDTQVRRACGCAGECSGCQPSARAGESLQTMRTHDDVGVGGEEAPPIVHEVLSTPGHPLEPSTRASMESRFGQDFSHVRVHSDGRAAESAQAVDATAYTVGRHIVFGPGQSPSGSHDSQQLLAHELTHVLQQTGSGVSSRNSATHAAQGAAHVGGALTNAGAGRLSRQPKGSGVTGGAKPVPGTVKYSEKKLPGGRIQIRAFGTVGDPISRPGLEKKYPLPKDVQLPNFDRWHLAGPDATGVEAGIAYAPKNFNISKTAEVENIVRKSRAAVREQGGDVYFDFTAECKVIGEREGVEIRVLEKVTWKVGVRSAGSENVVSVVNETASPTLPTLPTLPKAPTAAVPPSTGAGPKPPATATPVSPTPPKPAAPTGKPATAPEAPPAGAAEPPPVTASETPPAAGATAEKPPVVPEKPPTTPEIPPAAAAAEHPPATGGKPVVPGKRGGGSGAIGGLLGVALPIVLGWVHSRAVEKRIEQKAQTEGYVEHDAPSGKGRLYDIGAWLIDPLNDADKAVGFDKRFNFTVWRKRVRDVANGMKPGETLPMTWDVGKCKTDLLGHQEVEKRRIVYKKNADGKWSVESGNASGLPDLNDIISPDYPDAKLKAIIMDDPCSA